MRRGPSAASLQRDSSDTSTGTAHSTADETRESEPGLCVHIPLLLHHPNPLFLLLLVLLLLAVADDWRSWCPILCSLASAVVP